MDINIKVEIKTPMELVHAILALAETMAMVVDKQKGEALIDQHISREDKIEAQNAPQEPAKEEEKADAPPEEAEAPKVTLEEVRARLADLSKNGKQAEVKDLLKQFGAKKLTDVPAEKYGELLTATEGL